MSWLLFLDESGHDHRTMPYEVTGGIALQDKQLWPFVQAIRSLEVNAFGTELAQFKKEFKGAKLVDKKRTRWGQQADLYGDEERRKYAKRFLAKGLEKKSPKREDFTAYGQACWMMARGCFRLLHEHGAVIFASAIPKNVTRPSTIEATEFLRKDIVFLLERYFYFLMSKQEQGLLVMDQVEDANDRRFVRRLESYFTKTQKGVFRSTLIVPSPIFVSSTMSIPVQVADVCIYCLNWGFRLPSVGMNSPVREEIAEEFGPWLSRSQFQEEVTQNGETFSRYGIVYVPDPYTAR